ncbi:hypothetical protein ACROYT_G013671 [Oculina patagonica]
MLETRSTDLFFLLDKSQISPFTRVGVRYLQFAEAKTFYGNALDAVESTIHRIKAKDVVAALEDDDAEDIYDHDHKNDEDDNDEDNNVAGDNDVGD